MAADSYTGGFPRGVGTVDFDPDEPGHIEPADYVGAGPTYGTLELTSEIPCDGSGGTADVKLEGTFAYDTNGLDDATFACEFADVPVDVAFDLTVRGHCQRVGWVSTGYSQIDWTYGDLVIDGQGPHRLDEDMSGVVFGEWTFEPV